MTPEQAMTLQADLNTALDKINGAKALMRKHGFEYEVSQLQILAGDVLFLRNQVISEHFPIVDWKGDEAINEIKEQSRGERI